MFPPIQQGLLVRNLAILETAEFEALLHSRFFGSKTTDSLRSAKKPTLLLR